MSRALQSCRNSEFFRVRNYIAQLYAVVVIPARDMYVSFLLLFFY